MLLFGFQFLAALSIVLICEKTASRIGLMDQPGHRKIHENVTPRNGGLAIFLSVIFSIFYFKVQRFHVAVPSMILVFLGGLIDDVRKETPAYAKLIFQSLASALFLSQLDLPWPLKVYLFVFQIGITNSFNLMDNMNGVTTFLSFGIMGLLAFITQDFSTEFLICFFAANLAFLTRNYTKGKIFLGDQGSQFLGFLLSSIFIIECINEKTLSALHNPGLVSSLVFCTLMIFCVFSVFLMDTFWVIFIRLSRGQSIFNGDQNHLTHNLHRKGVPKLYVPWVLMFVQWPILALSMFVWSQFLDLQP